LIFYGHRTTKEIILKKCKHTNVYNSTRNLLNSPIHEIIILKKCYNKRINSEEKLDENTKREYVSIIKNADRIMKLKIQQENRELEKEGKIKELEKKIDKLKYFRIGSNELEEEDAERTEKLKELRREHKFLSKSKNVQTIDSSKGYHTTGKGKKVSVSLNEDEDNTIETDGEN